MKFLIVSEYIAPIQEIASIRWTKIAKYLKQNFPNVVIDVLTNPKSIYEHKDSLLEKEMVYFENYYETPKNFINDIYLSAREYYRKKIQWKKMSERKNKTQRAKAKETLSFLKCMIHDTKDLILIHQVKKKLRRVRLDYDVIISTYGPIWTHLIAEKLKKENPSAIWIADFRDPYAKDIEPLFFYKFHQKTTMKHCASADYILRVTDGLETFTPQNISRHTISNGYDPEERLEPLPPKKFNIVFTGALYGDRSEIGLAAKALCELCEAGEMEKDDVEISYAGQFGELAKALAKRYGAEEFICDYGLIPRQEALRMQQNAAILLLLRWNTTEAERALWTGKAYEYMMAQKPILYIMTGDIPYSEPSKYIDRLGGYCYEQCRHKETYQGMKDYILEKYREWKTTGNVTIQQDKEYIEQFAYPHIAEQVWQLIQEGMGKRNEIGAAREN